MSDKGKSDVLPGDGLRSVKTTNVFRAVNFELYTRPNRAVMVCGLVAIVGCLSYLSYMRWHAHSHHHQLVVLDDNSRARVARKSNWDL